MYHEHEQLYTLNATRARARLVITGRRRPCVVFVRGIKLKNCAKNASFFLRSFHTHRRQRIYRRLAAPFTIRGNIITQPAIENLDLGPGPNTPRLYSSALYIITFLPGLFQTEFA